MIIGIISNQLRLQFLTAPSQLLPSWVHIVLIKMYLKKKINDDPGKLESTFCILIEIIGLLVYGQ